jgi:hypothetical protein
MGRHFDFETIPKVGVPPGAYLADFLTDHPCWNLLARQKSPIGYFSKSDAFTHPAFSFSPRIKRS